jgi:hypothetical protein
MTTETPISEFFTAGGTLPPDAPSYVKRPTDEELFQHIMAREFCYILTPRQMGKSSLMIRTAQRLSKEGVRSAIVDLTQIGTVQSEDQWYKGILTQIARRLRLTVDPVSWWEQRKDIPNIQKFIEFFEETLSELKESVVIFMDEIDTTLKLDFRDNFFAGVRALFNARAENPDLKRITFVLLGVASPSDLIKDRNRTPFNIGQEIPLKPFSRDDARMLEKGLEEVFPKHGQRILDRVFYWTNGHPYLTQKICQSIVENPFKEYHDSEIDKLVEILFITEEASRETNLQFVRDNILSYPERSVILSLYKKLLRGGKVRDNKNSLPQNHLKLSGLASVNDGVLIISNQIYGKVFDLRWVDQNTPQNWNRIGAIGFAGLLVALIAVAAYISLRDAFVNNEIIRNQNDFRDATTASQRLASLANIFRMRGILQNTDTVSQARELFFTLNREDQLKLFTDPDIRDSTNVHPDLIIVIKGLYVTFADLDESGASNDLLSEMYDSLEGVTTEEGPNLREEIGFWLKARGVIKDDYDSGQLHYYNQAINEAEGQNQATLYERARILIINGDYDGALEDLDNVLALVKNISQETAPEINTSIPGSSSAVASFTPALSKTHTSGDMTAVVMSTFPSTAIVATLSPDPQTPLSPTDASNTPILTPVTTMEIPTATVFPPGYKSNFYTDIGISSAVRLLLIDNRPLLDAYYANPERYLNLANSGLVPPAVATTLTNLSSTAVLNTATTVNTSTVTPTKTLTLTPTLVILGIGYINRETVSVWREPNSGLIGTLSLNQSLMVLEKRDVGGSTWYRCTWEIDGVIGEGWILAEYIQLGPSPTSTAMSTACLNRERVIVLFADGVYSAQTEFRYSGKVLISISGTGQASGTEYTDAFYAFTDYEGNRTNPRLIGFSLTINGRLARDLISEKQVPPYQEDHIYSFVIDAPGGALRFGVDDTATDDNTGSYTIDLCGS